MKINTSQQKPGIVNMKSFSQEKGIENGKDLAIMGQNKDDLGIMEKPIAREKSSDILDKSGKVLDTIEHVVIGALELSAVGGVGFAARAIGEAAGGTIGGAVSLAAVTLATAATMYLALEGNNEPGEVAMAGSLTGLVALGGVYPIALPVLGAGMGLFNAVSEIRGENSWREKEKMLGLN